MSIYHIVKTYFHGTDEQWLKDRFNFFMEYTYPSLMNQTNPNFMLWFACGPGLEGLVKQSPLKRCLKAAFTYGDQHFPTVLNELGLKRLNGAQHVYVTRLDSDDLYAPDALQLVASYPLKSNAAQALIFQQGYLHDIHSGRWGIYRKHSSPFHTLIFPTESFTNVDKYKTLFGTGDHSQVAEKWMWFPLPENKLCVLIHGKNIGSTFENLMKSEFTPAEIEEKNLTLERFYAGEL